MKETKVVVTGLGALTALGNNHKDYWNSLINGVSGAVPVTRFDVSNFKTRFACEIQDFDPKALINRKDLRKMDLFTQYAIVASEEALQDSGILSEDLDKDRVGVIWGSGIGGLISFQEQMVDFGKRGENNPNYKFSPFFIPKMIVDIASGYISIRHGFRGPNFSVVSACASSTNALIDAFYYIKLGKADAFITGGSEGSVVEAALGGFGSMQALSKRNDEPKTASRPFDLDRDGFVLGEGAGALILESEEHALKRGAKIYAEIAGAGMSADAHHITAPHPEGLGARNVMLNALKDAQMNIEDIDYINVHGTSTPLGDKAEIKAIQEVFGEHAYNLNISSTKSMTGHLLGAAGAIEAIACIHAINDNIVPPTINHFTDDPAFDPKLNFTFNVAQKRTVRAALNNTFGFGGHNASIILKQYNN